MNWYESSSGNGLSATVGGFSVLGIAQAITLGAHALGHNLDQNTIVTLITAVVTAVGAIYAAFGIVRKLFYAWKG